MCFFNPQKPEIDWSDEEGEVPDNLEGNIKFSDVVFHYPARPSVQVCWRVTALGLIVSSVLIPTDSKWLRPGDPEGTDSGIGRTKWVWQEYRNSADSALLQSLGRTGTRFLNGVRKGALINIHHFHRLPWTVVRFVI